MKTFITKRAQRNYDSIKAYLNKTWGGKVAESFEKKTLDFLDNLEVFPQMGSVEIAEKQIRGFQLTKQIRVFYRIKGEIILILAFFDVRQNPKKKFPRKNND